MIYIYFADCYMAQVQRQDDNVGLKAVSRHHMERNCDSTTATGVRSHHKMPSGNSSKPSFTSTTSLDACISYERSPLKQLLEATISAYITTTHSRLSR